MRILTFGQGDAAKACNGLELYAMAVREPVLSSAYLRASDGTVEATARLERVLIKRRVQPHGNDLYPSPNGM